MGRDSGEYIQFILRYAENAKLREQEEKLEAKRQKEQLRLMEQHEKQQREDSKRRAIALKNLPERQLRVFLDGQRFKCNGCNASMIYQASCSKANSQAVITLPNGQVQVIAQGHTRISIEDMMTLLRHRVKDLEAQNEELKQRIIELQQQQQWNQQPKRSRRIEKTAVS